MKVCVNGATGFIGSHLVDRLLAEAFDVRCLVRPQSELKWLEKKPVRIVKCSSFTEPIAVADALADAEIVFHVLGTLVAPNLERFREVNARPVEAFLDACTKNKRLKRFVLVGSQGATGPNRELEGVLTEADSCNPVSDYGRSKLEAEEITRSHDGQVPFTIVRPSAMYGPRDKNFLKLFRMAKKGRSIEFGYAKKEISLAHVSDIVDGIFKAAMADAAVGQTYFLAGEKSYAINELKRSFELAVGKELRHLRIPDIGLKMMMLYADFLSMWFGKNVLLNRDRITTMSHGRWVCDISKARTELNYRPAISLEDGFVSTYDWYCREGWL